MAFLTLQNINKSFNGRQVLNDIQLSVEKGSFTSFLGQSGCGKTTLLRIIAGLEQADNGKILIEGKDITRLPVQERNIGIVFQNYALFPHMNVYDNIAYGLKIKKLSKDIIREKVNLVLEKVQLLSRIMEPVSSLSGGEQQRVALARAIVTEPSIILLDEPLSNLDHTLRLQARNELKRLQKETGITSIYVTHDQTEALSMSDNIAVMDDGKIIQTGSPAVIYRDPVNEFSANFIGHYNLFNQQSAKRLFDIDIHESAKLAILPEHLEVKISLAITGIFVTEILYTGILTEYLISAGESTIRSVVLSSEAGEFKVGDNVRISVSAQHYKVISQ